MKIKNLKEKTAKGVFFAAACVCILAVAIICIFLFINGVPAMAEIGVWDFISGTTWRPANDLYGIFPMILGSIYVTAGALLFGVPIGLLTAIYMGPVLPAPPAPHSISGSRAAGGHPLGGLRLLWPGRAGALCAG